MLAASHSNPRGSIHEPVYTGIVYTHIAMHTPRKLPGRAASAGRLIWPTRNTSRAPARGPAQRGGRERPRSAVRKRGMNPLDQFVRRELRCPAYVRYVDDMALFSDSKSQL